MKLLNAMQIGGLVVMFLLVFSAMAYSGAGLVGYWDFDEASWTDTADEVKDSSGEDNHGTAGGEVTTEEAGKFGRYGFFDGSDDYVECLNSPSLNPTQITVMAWVLPTEGTLNDQKFIVLKSFTAHAAPHYQYGLLMIDKAAYPQYVGFCVTIDDVCHRCSATETSFDYDEWHHLAGTYDGSEMKLYLDGAEVASESVSGDISSYDTPLLFGAYANLDKTSTYCFGGNIDDVAILDFPLAAADIKHAMNAGVAKAILAVDCRGKLTTAWGEIKDARQKQVKRIY